jgi:hypothetical protein
MKNCNIAQIVCFLAFAFFVGCGNEPERKPKDLLIGTWEGIVEGDKIVWTISSNGNEEYDWYHSTGVQHGTGKCSVENDTLYEQFEQNKTVCKLEFVTTDHLLLTVLDNGAPENKGQKRDYYRKK